MVEIRIKLFYLSIFHTEATLEVFSEKSRGGSPKIHRRVYSEGIITNAIKTFPGKNISLVHQSFQKTERQQEMIHLNSFLKLNNFSESVDVYLRLF